MCKTKPSRTIWLHNRITIVLVFGNTLVELTMFSQSISFLGTLGPANIQFVHFGCNHCTSQATALIGKSKVGLANRQVCSLRRFYSLPPKLYRKWCGGLKKRNRSSYASYLCVCKRPPELANEIIKCEMLSQVENRD